MQLWHILRYESNLNIGGHLQRICHIDFFVIYKTFVETEDELMTDFLFLIMHAGNSISKTFTNYTNISYPLNIYTSWHGFLWHTSFSSLTWQHSFANFLGLAYISAL